MRALSSSTNNAIALDICLRSDQKRSVQDLVRQSQQKAEAVFQRGIFSELIIVSKHITIDTEPKGNFEFLSPNFFSDETILRNEHSDSTETSIGAFKRIKYDTSLQELSDDQCLLLAKLKRRQKPFSDVQLPETSSSLPGVPVSFSQWPILHAYYSLMEAPRTVPQSPAVMLQYSEILVDRSTGRIHLDPFWSSSDGVTRYRLSEDQKGDYRGSELYVIKPSVQQQSRNPQIGTPLAQPKDPSHPHIADK